MQIYYHNPEISEDYMLEGDSDQEKDKKTRHCELTLAEKFEIHSFVKNNPDVIGTQVAKIFSEKFQKHLNNKIVYRIKRKGEIFSRIAIMYLYFLIKELQVTYKIFSLHLQLNFLYLRVRRIT